MAKKASVSSSTIRVRSRPSTTPRSSPIPGGVPPRLIRLSELFRQTVRQARNRLRTVGRDGGRSPEVITLDITEEEQFDITEEDITEDDISVEMLFDSEEEEDITVVDITEENITEEELFDGQVAELGATEERRLNSSQDTPPIVLNLPSSSPLPPRDSISTSTQTARTPPALRCPVCLQGLEDLVDRQEDLVSTLCGHVFCRSCLDTTLTSTR